ncbi:MAG TPA: type II toxin-antitoxin system HicB family antitoxin [Mycobacteriales bacterium]|nr:type II toxin-antitoxin system HicB family antitoxin [Mycobacteriales bacterium]
MNTFTIIIELGETGTYGAWSPELPGCVAVAEDQEECLELMRDAIRLHLDQMRANGEPIPHTGTVAATTFTPAA